MDDAACAGADPKLFYPSPGYNSRQGAKICARCPVREPCLEYSIATHELYGTWGGIPEKRRRSLIQLRYGRAAYYAIVAEEEG